MMELGDRSAVNRVASGTDLTLCPGSYYHTMACQRPSVTCLCYRSLGSSEREMVQERAVGVGPVDHIGVVVADSKAAAAEFGSKLGLQVDAMEVVEAVGVRPVHLVAPGPSHQCAVQLVEPIREGQIATFLQDHGEGPHHVCFTAPTLGEALDALGDKEATVFLGGKGRRACFLTDRPSGVLVELVEPLPPADGTET